MRLEEGLGWYWNGTKSITHTCTTTYIYIMCPLTPYIFPSPPPPPPHILLPPSHILLPPPQAEEEFNIEKGRLLQAEKRKVANYFERKEKHLDLQRKMYKENLQSIMLAIFVTTCPNTPIHTHTCIHTPHTSPPLHTQPTLQSTKSSSTHSLESS